jgi:transcriptional regulator GlxA family with amidase domain
LRSRRHSEQPLDLDRLAAVAGVSKFHFVRSVETTYAETPIRYLDNSGNWLVLVEPRE